MTKTMGPINRFLSRHVPEQRIYMRTDRGTRYVRLSPISQTVIGATVAVGFCWSIIATSALVIDYISAKSEKVQAEVMQQSYNRRLAELSDERDLRALEAQKAQERFYVALEQISFQQSDLLEAEEERRELATGLQIMQKKLQSAVKQRDVAQVNSDKLLSELQTVTGSMNTRLDEAGDIRSTLAFINDAFQETVTERDEMRLSTSEMQERMSTLEFDMALMEEQGERIFERLEEATEVALVPLNRALNRSGINTDALLRDVRRGYSGTGGPTTPLTMSSSMTRSDLFSKRADTLLKELDRANLMKIAARKVPLGHPVAGTYRYTSGFGTRKDPKNGGRRMHNGTDMAGPRGTPIVSPGDGVVTFAGRQSGFGNLIKIKHAQGFETYFAHLNKIRVKTGQKVSRGMRIGDMGTTGRSTGVHLHYEIRINGRPVNPMTYIKAANDVF